MFHKYQHIEKFGTDETEGIEIGKTYVFPKIDGTNGCLWVEGGIFLHAGSRKRELSGESDNAGFYAWAVAQQNIKDLFLERPNYRLYGEWLVPHSLKTYRQDAWRNFYVFDVCEDTEDGYRYLSYEEYKPLLEKHGIEYIPPLRIVNNGNYETYVKLLKENNYLIEDGKGCGEGIVIKNYQFSNKYGRTTWAKIVTSEFKEKHHREMGPPEVNGGKAVEDRIVEDFCTTALIRKTFEKIKLDGWSSKKIPQLIGTVWHDFINEEIWNIIKKMKNPTIDFKNLQRRVTIKIKTTLPDVF